MSFVYVAAVPIGSNFPLFKDNLCDLVAICIGCKRTAYQKPTAPHLHLTRRWRPYAAQCIRIFVPIYFGPGDANRSLRVTIIYLSVKSCCEHLHPLTHGELVSFSTYPRVRLLPGHTHQDDASSGQPDSCSPRFSPGASSRRRFSSRSAKSLSDLLTSCFYVSLLSP